MDHTITNIAILGSTGSIGTQTLDVVRRYPDRFRVNILTAGRNVDLLAKQALEFRPHLAVIADESLLPSLRSALEGSGVEVAAGAEAIADAMDRDDFDTVVTATVGYSGLQPTIRAILNNKQIALANKETLVVAGELINEMLKESRSEIIPVDSEHSAIYQCLQGEAPEAVEKLIITASGGPFRRFPAEKLRDVTVADALAHPNWSMGAKITIDSATLINKAFEIIEARWLFHVRPDQIEAVVHPQSIVHSMVQFRDGAIKAQLGIPDMHLPIRYALARCERLPSEERRLAIEEYATLTFERPDTERFPGILLADYALSHGGNSACVINAANEIAVAAFLAGSIKYPDIYHTITETLGRVPFIDKCTYATYVDTNSEARRVAREIVDKINR